MLPADAVANLQAALRASDRRRAEELDPVTAEISSISARRQAVQNAQLKAQHDKAELSAAGKSGAKDLSADRLAALNARLDRANGELEELDAETHRLVAQQVKIEALLRNNVAVLRDSQGNLRTIPLLQIVRVYQPNAMGFFARLGQYFAKVWELLSTPPRESNTEGGVLPALFGTVTLVFLMAICGFPLGVLAGIYLGEYAAGRRASPPGPHRRKQPGGHSVDRLRHLRRRFFHRLPWLAHRSSLLP